MTIEEAIKGNQRIDDQMIAYYLSKNETKGLTMKEMLDKWRDGISETNEPEPDEVEDDEEDDDYAYDGYDDYYY